MAPGKENLTSQASKIPIPVDPLPPIPEHLYKKIRLDTCIERSTRQPLKTINYDNPMPSTSNNNRVKARRTVVYRLDTSHVTVRGNGNEELDQDYKELKDGNRTECLNNKHISKTVVTPTLKPCNLEPGKNIKKSLKRPHSRGLQGLSPSKNTDTEQKFRRCLFICDQCDHLQERLKSPDFTSRLYMLSLNRNYTNHIFSYLMKAELKAVGIPKISRLARACLLNWLIKINGLNGNPAVIETACWYLDSILSKKEVSSDKLQLVAAACFWIAQKLFGPSYTALRLVKYSGQAFTSKDLLHVEKCILIQLNFPSQPKVPQDYIAYLAWRCDKSNPGEIEVVASFLCMAGMLVDISLCSEYPSAVAAAAVMNALYLLGKKALMERLKMCKVFKAAKEKTTNFSFICALQKKAVLLIRSIKYEYKALLEVYGAAPHCIEQRIGNAIECTIKDTKNTALVRRNTAI